MVDYYYEYGITEQEYQEMVEKQNNCCAICHRHKSMFSRRLAVDHAHIRGYDKLPAEEKKRYVRGVLCANCNRGLPFYRDDPVFLHRAGDYLTDFFKRFNENR